MLAMGLFILVILLLGIGYNIHLLLKEEHLKSEYVRRQKETEFSLSRLMTENL